MRVVITASLMLVAVGRNYNVFGVELKRGEKYRLKYPLEQLQN